MMRLYATIATCILLSPATMALADAKLIAFPEGYEDSFTQYTIVNRADERKQVVKIFANDTALASAKDGAPLDSGSVIVMEIYKAELDANEQPVTGADGFFVPGELTAITVMETRDGWGADYPAEWRNDEWEFAAFTADNHSLVERDYQPCFGCHKPLAEADFLFSFEALKQAAGGS
jgi:Cytochrome P460